MLIWIPDQTFPLNCTQSILKYFSIRANFLQTSNNSAHYTDKQCFILLCNVHNFSAYNFEIKIKLSNSLG